MGKTKFGGRKPAEIKREVKRPAPPKRPSDKKPTASDMIRDGHEVGKFM